MTFAPKPKRKPLFDWDEARRLVAGGMSYRKAAAELGVTRNAVARVCDPARYEEHKRHAAGRRNNYSEGKKCPGCGKPIVDKATTCAECFGKRLVEEARDRIELADGRLLCRECNDFKEPGAFSKGTVRARGMRKSICRQCDTDRKRRYRQRWLESS